MALSASKFTVKRPLVEQGYAVLKSIKWKIKTFPKPAFFKNCFSTLQAYIVVFFAKNLVFEIVTILIDWLIDWL